MPLTETGMEKVVRLRKSSLSARGRTPRFHSVLPQTRWEPLTMIPRLENEAAGKNSFPIAWKRRDTSNATKVEKTSFRKIVILVGLVTVLAHSGRPALPERLIHSIRRSPDGRWEVAWRCQETPTPKCRVVFSRVSDGRVFFQRSTFPRYIQAVWNRTSTKCLLLDAPENANTFLWLLRIRHPAAAVEKIDDELIWTDIERARPEARRNESQVTRLGVEKITWVSDSEVRLHIIYNGVSVVVCIDASKPNRPRIEVVS